MPYRTTPLINGSYYHIFNRGVEKRHIFSNSKDYERFLSTLFYYRFSGPKPSFSLYRRFKNRNFSNNPKIVEVLTYCLMPNHFHLLLKQLVDNGISEFVSKISNGYTKYFNTKHNRIGPLLQGAFKAVPIETDKQLLHLSRYIHLNPFVSELSKDLKEYKYSSYREYTGLDSVEVCSKELILNFFKTAQEYKKFVDDHSSYALDLERIKHMLLDEH